MTQAGQTTDDRAAEAISRRIAAYLGAQIEPGFRVIRYPPGYNFNVQYGMPVMWNPHTFGLIDQICRLDGPHSASMTGSSFSAEFAAILASVGYHTSTADIRAQKQAIGDFDRQGDRVVQVFEAEFGPITAAMIQASGAVPRTKPGYVSWYVGAHYPGTPPRFPPVLASFSAAYAAWLSLGETVEKSARQAQAAAALVSAARAHSIHPGAGNGGFPTGPSAWSVAYCGLPTNNQINAGLDNRQSTVSVTIDVEDAGAGMASLSLDRQSLGRVPRTDLRLSVAAAPEDTARPVDPWAAARHVGLEIVYTGITAIRADPVSLSADRQSGWFSLPILQQIVAKTGKDVTGLQLQGSAFSIDALFGPGGSFARVQTFVIAQQPTVKMTFRGTNLDALAGQVTTDQAAQLSLGKIVSLGVDGRDYRVLDMQSTGTELTVTLGAAPPSGTVPLIDQTAHVIGGVIQFPA